MRLTGRGNVMAAARQQREASLNFMHAEKQKGSLAACKEGTVRRKTEGKRVKQLNMMGSAKERK